MNRGEKTGNRVVVPTVCSTHCGGACLLNVRVEDGRIRRVEALDIAAAKLKQVHEDFDPEAILCMHAPGDQVFLNNYTRGVSR